MGTRGVDRSLTGAQKKCFLMRNPGDCRYPELFLSRSARITAWASLSALRSTLRSRCISFPMLCRTMPTKNIATVIGISTQLRMSESRRSVLILASCCAVTLGVPVCLKGRQRTKRPGEMIRNVTHQAHFDGRGRDDDGLEAESQDSRSGCRRYREHGYIERGVEQEGHEAEESPLHKGAVRARGEASLELQGVQRLSARSSAL